MGSLHVVRVLLAGAVLAAGLTAIPSSSANADPVTPAELLTTDPFAGTTPPDYQMSYVLAQAELRARADPSVYAQPYLSEDGTLVMPVTSQGIVTEAGQAFSVPSDLSPQDDGIADVGSVPPPLDESQVGPAEDPATSPLDLTPEQKSVPAAPDPGGTMVSPQVEIVKYSWGQLEAIMDDFATLTAGTMPDLDKIVSLGIHPERDQIIVEVIAATDELRTALAARYGSDAIAIWVVDDPGPVGPAAETRQWDSSTGGFYGGAKIYANQTCTTGFSWRYSGYQAMLTAGHCTLPYYFVNTPAERLGTVYYDNYVTGTGTVLLSGQYWGDISLIRVVSGKASAGRIFVGGPTSGWVRLVAGMWSRRAYVNDMFCTGGQLTGELCGWKVTATRKETVYKDTGERVRYVVVGQKQGTCLRKGDSGGPVYTVNSAGKVVAKGLISGGGGGGSDNWGGAFDPCYVFFTDIWDAYYGLPGYLATS
jgi:hypothetical protein